MKNKTITEKYWDWELPNEMKPIWGEVEFRSVLYIPGMAPLSNEEIMNPKTKNIRLYVKIVFISDDFDSKLFPRYLSFIKGVVDSNDLPLNVSREILQESRVVRIMRKRPVRKTFDMIQEIAEKEDKDVRIRPLLPQVLMCWAFFDAWCCLYYRTAKNIGRVLASLLNLVALRTQKSQTPCSCVAVLLFQ